MCVFVGFVCFLVFLGFFFESGGDIFSVLVIYNIIYIKVIKDTFFFKVLQNAWVETLATGILKLS